MLCEALVPVRLEDGDDDGQGNRSSLAPFRSGNSSIAGAEAHLSRRHQSAARPSLAVKGPSSGGKSYLVESVLTYFPARSYYALTGMSERALAYDDEPLSHRVLVLYEAAGMSGEFASYLLRSLLSEGRVRYVTVESTADGLRPRHIDRPGPTGLIVTTTAISLHAENETRMFSLPVTDTPEQTRAVLLALASDKDDHRDLAKWHALQEWLSAWPPAVVIPYALRLALAVPPVAVRLRRDFGAVLRLIEAHALLHQASRARDDRGAVIATLADYRAVRELVVDLVAEGVEASVPATTRETVAAVERLGRLRPMAADSTDDAGVTAAALGRELGLDKSAARRRAKGAIERGFLTNLEGRRGRPMRLVLGERFPDEVEVLPDADFLEAADGGRVAPEWQGSSPHPPEGDETGLVARAHEVFDGLIEDEGP